MSETDRTCKIPYERERNTIFVLPSVEGNDNGGEGARHGLLYNKIYLRETECEDVT
jgi:hypothetical protein